MDPAILDPDAFDHLLEITGGELEFVEELIDTYLEDAVAQLGAMRTGAAAADVGAIVRPAHSLKSSSANVGAKALEALCRSLEADATSGAMEDPSGRVAEVAAAFERARAALVAEREARQA
ncbi:MAG TPA: Hpt domain-containing protein [Candidatus Saccharimonadales bacterium]|nr:Hpt domain-containing protein [Candidatus Saccharimonadales bacterium]